MQKVKRLSASKLQNIAGGNTDCEEISKCYAGTMRPIGFWAGAGVGDAIFC